MPIIKLKDNESFDSGLRRFKRSCDKAGIISEIRKREFYENLPLSGKEKLQQQLRDKLKEESSAKCRL